MAVQQSNSTSATSASTSMASETLYGSVPPNSVLLQLLERAVQFGLQIEEELPDPVSFVDALADYTDEAIENMDLDSIVSLLDLCFLPGVDCTEPTEEGTCEYGDTEAESADGGAQSEDANRGDDHDQKGEAQKAPSDEKDVSVPRECTEGGVSPNYANQVDNKQRNGKAPDSQCGATSLTMALLSMFDNDPTALMAETKVLVEAEGGKWEAGLAPEEGIVLLLSVTNWDRAFQDAPAYFGYDPNWRKDHKGANVIKSPYAHAYTASRFSTKNGSGLTIASVYTTIEDGETLPVMTFDERWDWVLKQVQDGGHVTFQGAFTSTGHVVYIVEMSSSDMVIHDPYGMHFHSAPYLHNGKAPSATHKLKSSEFLERVNGQGDLIEAWDKGAVLKDWGKNNWYSKEEIKGLDGLLWALVIDGRTTCEESDEAEE